MTWMFLYPLVGGVLFYAVLAWRWPDGREAPGFRLFMNLYNAGIAALTVGSFLRGVLVIAGAESPYAWVLPALGWTLAGLGLVTLMIWRMRCRKPAG